MLVNVHSTDNDVSNTDDVEVKEFIPSDKQETQLEKCKIFSYHNITSIHISFSVHIVNNDINTVTNSHDIST